MFCLMKLVSLGSGSSFWSELEWVILTQTHASLWDLSWNELGPLSTQSLFFYVGLTTQLGCFKEQKLTHL